MIKVLVDVVTHLNEPIEIQMWAIPRVEDVIDLEGYGSFRVGEVRHVIEEFPRRGRTRPQNQTAVIIRCYPYHEGD